MQEESGKEQVLTCQSFRWPIIHPLVLCAVTNVAEKAREGTGYVASLRTAFGGMPVQTPRCSGLK